MEAIDKVTIEIDYERPYFQFPDIHGPDGNPMFYWPKAIAAIRKNGFKKEAEEISLYYSHSPSGVILPLLPYAKQFDFLAHFLNFESQQMGEDDNYIYLKVKKEDSPLFDSTKQPTLFKINNIETLQEFIDNGEDLSITNCYGRNILYYINNVDTLAFLLKQNETHQWFDVFDLDNFGGNVLHAHRDIACFSLLLEHMHKEDSNLSRSYLSMPNYFNLNAATVYLSEVMNSFFGTPQYVVKNISESKWTTLKHSLKIINMISPELFHNTLNNIEKTISKSEFKEHPLYNNYQHFLKTIFDDMLENKNDVDIPKSKI